jgi:hypothetical protein
LRGFSSRRRPSCPLLHAVFDAIGAATTSNEFLKYGVFRDRPNKMLRRR